MLLATPLGTTDTAHADVQRLYVESAFVQPGGTIEIDVIAEATEPGLGAWNVDLQYDADLLSLTHVASKPGICSPAFAFDTARMVGASANGLMGTIVLCTLTFDAGDEEGEAALDVIINQLTDPTGGDISVRSGDGTITIAPATPTPVPTITQLPVTPVPTTAPTAVPATVTPAAHPNTGGEPGDGSMGMSAWLLAIVGLAVVSGGVWAVARTRR